MAETQGLRGTREASAARLSEAKRQKLAPRPPSAAIAGYEAAADAYAARVAKLVEKHIVARMADPAGLQLGLAALELDLHELAGKMRRHARTAGGRSLKRAYVEVGRMLQLKVPRDVRMELTVDNFATENVQLFRKLAHAQVEKLRQALAQPGADAGDVRHALWVSRNRARLIATDQSHKLFGAQVRMWSRIAGSDAYVYVTARDERVRATHRPHDGKVFRWDAPPATGHPGTQPNCRCRTIPVESPLLP